jgi:hypothetical protein
LECAEKWWKRGAGFDDLMGLSEEKSPAFAEARHHRASKAFSFEAVETDEAVREGGFHGAKFA